MDNTTKTYDFVLPVFKQGDDLHRHIKENPNDPAKALLDLAERYEAAASLSRRVAAVVAEATGAKLHADTHMIQVTGPASAFTGLVMGKVLTVPRNEDEEKDDESDEDDE